MASEDSLLPTRDAARSGRRLAAALALAALAFATWDLRARDAAASSLDPQHPFRPAQLESVPRAFGEWIARDVPCPQSAVEMLNPSALLSREYRNSRTQESVNLLVVQCSDARDLMGHYPPNCYPAHGWIMRSGTSRDWDVDGVAIPGVRYRFEGEDPEAGRDVVVDNFLVLPDGAYGRTDDELARSVRSVQTRRRGASQVQVVTGGSMDDGRRDEIFRSFVGQVRPFLAGGVSAESAHD